MKIMQFMLSCLVVLMLAAEVNIKSYAFNFGEQKEGADARSKADWTVTAELTAAPGNHFGESVALSRDGNTLLVAAAGESCTAGDDCGVVHVFIRHGNAWREQAALVSPDQAPNEMFGGCTNYDRTIAVSGDGNTALVGTCPTFSPGPVYIFTRSGGTWSPRQKLTLPKDFLPGPQEYEGDGFGHSPALSDDGHVVVVGAPWEAIHEDKGAAYVFVKQHHDQWQPTARLTGSMTAFDLSDPENFRLSIFGWSVAVAGDGKTVLVGAPGVPADLQQAYVFEKTRAKGWVEQSILTAADGSPINSFEGFGRQVALSRSGHAALIGDGNADDYVGVVYSFRQDRDTGAWRQEAKLGSDLLGRSTFGFSADLDDEGDTVIVGDWGASTAYLFEREQHKGVVAWESHLLLNGNDYGSSSGTGSAVALSGNGRFAMMTDPAISVCPNGEPPCAAAFVLQR